MTGRPVAPLTPEQRRDVQRARELLTASREPQALIDYLATRGTIVDRDPYPEAFGSACVALEYLLDIIDALTRGQS
jgi:hypothetical protein